LTDEIGEEVGEDIATSINANKLVGIFLLRIYLYKIAIGVNSIDQFYFFCPFI
jgi:hypothetical protein